MINAYLTAGGNVCSALKHGF